MSITTEKLEATLELLREHCIRGYLHFRIWRRINIAFKEIPQKLEQFEMFMIMSWEAHDDAARIHLARLFDRDSKSVSLHKLLSTVKANPQLFKFVERQQLFAAVAEDKARLDGELHDLLDRLRAHRTTYLAHLDDSLVRKPDEILSDQTLTYHDMEKLYVAATEMIRRYQKFYSDETWRIETVIGEDTVDWLFDFINKHTD